MIKEAYCSYEISKPLKEKGFDECIFEFYVGDSVMYARNGEGFRLSELPDIYYPHITHQMACAWLREEKNIHIDIYYLPIHRKYMWSIVETKDPKGAGSKELYEDAVEAALKYTLENLI